MCFLNTPSSVAPIPAIPRRERAFIVRLQFDAVAAQGLEGVREQEQLRLVFAPVPQQLGSN